MTIQRKRSLTDQEPPWQKTINHLQSQLEQAQQQIQQRDRSIQKLNAENERLSATDRLQENNELIELLESLNNENEQLQAENDQLNGAIQKLNAENDKLVETDWLQENKQLNKKIVAEGRKLKQKQRILNIILALNEKVFELELENKHLRESDHRREREWWKISASDYWQ